MHNVRRMSARGEARRRTRETVVAPALRASVPDTQTMIERVELQRVVARLVLQLDEPYKTTVLLRFYDGRSSPEVGRLLGVPEGTVRWRLKEALARLRRLLDKQHGNAARDWRAVLLPLAPPFPAGVVGKGGLTVAAKSKLSSSGFSYQSSGCWPVEPGGWPARAPDRPLPPLGRRSICRRSTAGPCEFSGPSPRPWDHGWWERWSIPAARS